LGSGFNSREEYDSTLGRALCDGEGREERDVRINVCNESSYCFGNANVSNSSLYSMQNDSCTHDISAS